MTSGIKNQWWSIHSCHFCATNFFTWVIVNTPRQKWFVWWFCTWSWSSKVCLTLWRWEYCIIEFLVVLIGYLQWGYEWNICMRYFCGLFTEYEWDLNERKEIGFYLDEYDIKRSWPHNLMSCLIVNVFPESNPSFWVRLLLTFQNSINYFHTVWIFEDMYWPLLSYVKGSIALTRSWISSRGSTGAITGIPVGHRLNIISNQLNGWESPVASYECVNPKSCFCSIL